MNRLFAGCSSPPLVAARRQRVGHRASREAQRRRPPRQIRSSPARKSGRPGGQLVVIQRTEPRTLNPVIAIDSPSQGRHLAHDRGPDPRQPRNATTRTGAGRSPGRSRPTAAGSRCSLRRGVRFSDGDPFDADDVLFSFQVYLDEKVASPQRDLLIVGGKPIAVRKLDQETVQVDLAEPYAAAERLFDSVAMLPRHLLEQALQGGPAGGGVGPAHAGARRFAGLGPFRFKEHVPGERLVLERNPFYWKEDRAGKPLPYLDRLVFIVRAERRRAGGAVSVGRGRHHDAFERGEFRRPLEGPARSGTTSSRISAPDSTTRSSSSTRTIRPEKAPAGDGAQADLVSAAGVPASRVASRSIARASFASPIAAGPRRSGVMSRPGNKLWVNRSLPKPAPFGRARAAAASERRLRVEGGRHAGRQGGSARRVHRRHQLRQRGTDPDRDDHPGRSETARDARQCGDARAARPARSRS